MQAKSEIEPAVVITTYRVATSEGLGWILSCWWIAFAASSVAVVSGHLLIKDGLNASATHWSGSSVLWQLAGTMLQPSVVGGLTIYFLGTMCWMVAVAQREISFLYPLSSVNYLLVMVTSSVFFSEVISLRRASGVACIVLGMFLMNRRGVGR